jgi:putative nucleotidyltransferase with HDIG domain
MSVATMPPELALDALPTLPIVALQIGEVIHSRVASVAQVATVLRTDPATSAKLLRLVNSPYFGIPGGVSDVARAIPFVGFNTLYQLVLTISVLDTLDTKDGFDPKVLWLHSLTVATAARELATDLRFSDPGSCFTAGLLHDMGRIALARLQPAKMAAVSASTKAGMSVHDAERLHQLAPHDTLGSRLAKQWKFPATLAVPIEQHHAVHKQEVRDRLPPNLRTISEIVAVADDVAKACAEPFTHAGGADNVDGSLDALFERNGYGQHRAAQMIDRTKKELERAKVFLSLLA